MNDQIGHSTGSELLDEGADNAQTLPGTPANRDAMASSFANSHRLSNPQLEHLYEQAMRSGGVLYAPEIDYWVVTHYDELKSIFRNTDIFSPENALRPFQPISPRTGATFAEAGFVMSPIMVDNPDKVSHGRVRRVHLAAMSPARLNRLIPTITELADRAIDSFFAEGKADLVGQMLYELPALVLFKLMGVDDAHAQKIKKWADQQLMVVWGRLTPEDQEQAALKIAEYWKFCVELVANRRINPGDDLPSAFLEIEEDGKPALTNDEAVSLVFGLLLAGHETTTNQSANTILALLETPGAWQQLASNPELIPGAVEEGLRFRPSVIAWRRMTKQDVHIQGQAIPAGSNLLLMLAAANRDPANFVDPAKFDVSRPNAKEHVSFGHGAHFCIGAPLARLEMKIILERLTQRIPSMRLVAGQQIEAIETIQFRGPKQLLVEWNSEQP